MASSGHTTGQSPRVSTSSRLQTVFIVMSDEHRSGSMGGGTIQRHQNPQTAPQSVHVI
ncbi:hypothetical protein PAMP_000002 [Pampus punctatissimus]